MRRLRTTLIALVMACSGSSAAPSRQVAAEPIGELTPTRRASMCVTLGHVDSGAFAGAITAPKVRAVVPDAHGDAAELRFVYAGPSEEEAPLASGQVRRQVGLKLRAADGCNLVYVMWRWAPGRPMLEVSVKRNRGAATHAACGTAGYRKLEPDRVVRAPRPAYGNAHTLSARIEGDRLTATIDGTVVWRGSIGADARDLRGLAGLRTDNVALSSVELWTATAREPLAAAAPPTCEPPKVRSAGR